VNGIRTSRFRKDSNEATILDFQWVCGTEAVSSDGSLIGDEIDERASDDRTCYNGKCHPDRQPDSVAPETLIVILECVFSEEGSVLVSENRSFGPGPRIVVRRDLDDVAGHR